MKGASSTWTGFYSIQTNHLAMPINILIFPTILPECSATAIVPRLLGKGGRGDLIQR